MVFGFIGRIECLFYRASRNKLKGELSSILKRIASVKYNLGGRISFRFAWISVAGIRMRAPEGVGAAGGMLNTNDVRMMQVLL